MQMLYNRIYAPVQDSVDLDPLFQQEQSGGALLLPNRDTCRDACPCYRPQQGGYGADTSNCDILYHDDTSFAWSPRSGEEEPKRNREAVK